MVVFYADWMNNEVYKNKTARLIILSRALQPAKVTVGKFADLDLRTFILVSFNFFKKKIKIVLLLGYERCVFVSYNYKSFF